MCFYIFYKFVDFNFLFNIMVIIIVIWLMNEMFMEEGDREFEIFVDCILI